jgi:hypothetical protein
MLKNQPGADAWYLAAQACESKEKAIYCLRRALDLQPQHSAANRLLFRLEGAKPPTVREQPSVDALTVDVPLKAVKRAKQSGRKRGARRAVVLLSLLLFGMSCSLITMNLIGVISGPITLVTQLTGGASPVNEIDGTPIAQVSDAPLRMKASQSESLAGENAGRDTDVLEPGYLHEYTFEAQQGRDVAIYVQFLSLAANRVSRNVVVLREDESNATPGCERDTILQGDNNITLVCRVDTGGTWKVRILGRAGESVGAYFVGVEQMRS